MSLTLTPIQCIIVLVCKNRLFSGGINIIKKILLILLRLLSLPYVYGVLFITLIWRKPTYTHNFKPPFWEISQLIGGNRQMLFDIIGNILLLFPLGFFLPIWFRKADKPKKVVLICFFVSVAIEITQLITTRGYFETDDLLHNTIGALMGALLGCSLAKQLYTDNKKTQKK